MASSVKPDDLPAVNPQHSHGARRKPDPEDLL